MRTLILILWLVAATAFGQFNFKDLAFNAPRSSALVTNLLYTNYTATANRGNFSGLVGMLWTNTEAITVTDLGRWNSASNNYDRLVTLVLWTNSSSVANVTLRSSNQTEGVFIYTNLVSPVVLIAGAVYCLVSPETNGASTFQDARVGEALGVFSSGTYGGAVYSVSYAFSGLVYEVRNKPYGPFDLKYTLP